MTRRELFFLLAYTFYIISRLIENSTLKEVFPGLFIHMLNFGIVFCASTSFISQKTFSKKSFSRLLIVLVISILTFYGCRSRDFLYVVILLLASYRISFQKIIKTSFYINLLGTIIIVSLSIVHFLPDYIYYHYNVLSGETSEAHSFGFLYYSGASYIIMFLSMMLVYFAKDKRKKYAVAMMIVTSYINYRLFSTRAVLVIPILYISIYELLKHAKFMNIKVKIWKFVAVFLPGGLFIISVILAKAYQANNPLFYMVNQVFSNRFSQGHLALERYGISLFGQPIKMYGTYSMTYGSGRNMSYDNYFFIDSGYIYSLVVYGVLFTIILLIVYSSLLEILIEDQNIELFSWSLIVIIFSCINNPLLEIQYNPVLFIGFTAFVDKIKYRRKIYRNI